MAVLCLSIVVGLYLAYRALIGWPATPMTVSRADRLFSQKTRPGMKLKDVTDWLASQGIPEGSAFMAKNVCYSVQHRREDVTFKGWWMAVRGNQTVAECAGLSVDDVYSVISVLYPEADRFPLGITEVTVYLFFDEKGKLIRETPIFTRVVTELLTDEEYHSLQLALLFQPRAGRVIRGSGGLRKLRWSRRGQGKRGGIRVIYFWEESSGTFYLLYAFRKNEQEDLSVTQLRVLSRLVREEFHEER